MSLYHGGNRHSNTIYGDVKDFHSGELLISATHDYCVRAVKDRGWKLRLPLPVHKSVDELGAALCDEMTANLRHNVGEDKKRRGEA
jgi:hypothetical protein